MGKSDKSFKKKVKSSGYPNDADGDFLREIAESGNDMTKPMEIDFVIAVESKESGESIADKMSQMDYSVCLRYDEDYDIWNCYCTKIMVAEYDEIVRIQKELEEFSRPLGGYSDGWGTFGNIEGN